MSFETLKINELREIADSFGVELPEKANKQSVVKILSEEGITYDMYAKFSGAEQVEVKLDEQPKKKDRKSTRLNSSH